jgi:hypothetical protein
MFTDPQSVKIGGTTYSLPRVNSGNLNSGYTNEDSSVDLSIATQKTAKNRLRHTVRVDKSKISADSFDTTQNVENSASAYLVIDRPLAGFTNTEAEEIVKGLLEFLSASTYSAVKKVLARES